MARLIYVNINNVSELVAIIAGLSHEGISFVARLQGSEWVINIS